MIIITSIIKLRVYVPVLVTLTAWDSWPDVHAHNNIITGDFASLIWRSIPNSLVVKNYCIIEDCIYDQHTIIITLILVVILYKTMIVNE